MQKKNNNGEFEPFPVKELNAWLEEQLKDVDRFSATLIIDVNGVTGDIINKFLSQSSAIDCAALKEGDFAKCVNHLSGWNCRSVFFDNIDRIPDFEEKEDWEYLIRFALKKEYYPLNGKDIEFEKLQVVARGLDFPTYIKPASMHAVILNYNEGSVGAIEEDDDI